VRCLALRVNNSKFVPYPHHHLVAQPTAMQATEAVIPASIHPMLLDDRADVSQRLATRHPPLGGRGAWRYCASGGSAVPAPGAAIASALEVRVLASEMLEPAGRR
jgi:hypothetical protein